MRSFNLLFQVLAAGLLLMSVVANPAARKILQRAACTESYAPCTCDLTANGVEVTCVDVTVAEIVDVFFRTRTLDIYSVTLTATSATGSIDLPADLLKDKRAKNIYLNCPSTASPDWRPISFQSYFTGYPSPKLGLTVDPASFEFTRFDTTRFEIHDCDLVGQLNMDFLVDFSVLNTLHIENSENVKAIETLPALPQLKELAVVSCTGLTNVLFPDLTPARLERLYLNGNALDDATANGILVSIGSSSSSSSLVELSLASNSMTKVPRIASFSKLSWYDVSSNAIPFISQSALIFGSPVNFLGLNNVALTAIEGGAFLGDYTFAQVNLENNDLTAFREDVFKSMLQLMAAQPAGGQVIVTGNPFDCGCGLAWLIRDNPTLIPNVKNGVCGGFFRFEDLNPESYANC
ncbi:hypothetical protein GHT06_019914 [Daphnia sinensis]|uniref:Membrane glycoprotein lig-1 n=1 Tax=Daphnia sinensis TaxID=1820382 RepID=A0AAD5PP19_9CRUS|nr:hypothetical protein GHT06_019914 [Daphnia sinensis]